MKHITQGFPLRDAGSNVKSRGRRKPRRETPVPRKKLVQTYDGVTRTHVNKPRCSSQKKRVA